MLLAWIFFACITTSTVLFRREMWSIVAWCQRSHLFFIHCHVYFFSISKKAWQKGIRTIAPLRTRSVRGCHQKEVGNLCGQISRMIPIKLNKIVIFPDEVISSSHWSNQGKPRQKRKEWIEPKKKITSRWKRGNLYDKLPNLSQNCKQVGVKNIFLNEQISSFWFGCKKSKDQAFSWEKKMIRQAADSMATRKCKTNHYKEEDA